MLKLIVLLGFISTSVCEKNIPYTFTTKYFEVPLDHFSFTTNTTFKLRYLINDSYHVERGPIFFYTGNEGDITTFAQNTGFMFDISKEFNALIVFAEHRYYGESLPFGNESYSKVEHLGYLSSSQALADYVDLIDYLQNSYSVSKDLKKLPVVAFGGSYGGMLAAWLRMKYPSSIIGAIASSAPIWQFDGLVPCENFYKVTTDVYRITGSNLCKDVIQKSWAIVRSKAKNATGMADLSKQFKLCVPLKTDDDVNKFVDWLSNIYVNMAMVNYPYPNNFLSPLPGYPVKAFCNKMKITNVDDLSDDNVVKLLTNALELYTNGTGKKQCNDINTSSSVGEKGWYFQSCTEMIMPMCSTDKDMFENQDWNFKAYSDQCFKDFDVRPRNQEIPILLYGGKNLKPYSNIVFSNGLMDPWSSGGVLYNTSSSVLAVVIPDGAHHFDLRAENPLDTETVKEARRFHRRQIHKWLDEFYFENIADSMKYNFVKKHSI